MNLPITSRVKRSAILKTSALKQTKEEAIRSAQQGGNLPPTSIVGEGGTTTIETPGVKTTENLDALNATKIDLGPDYKPSAAETARANAEVAAAKAADEEASSKPTVTTIEEPDVETQTATKREGQVQCR
jgi:hypothetical protein